MRVCLIMAIVLLFITVIILGVKEPINTFSKELLSRDIQYERIMKETNWQRYSSIPKDLRNEDN